VLTWHKNHHLQHHIFLLKKVCVDYRTSDLNTTLLAFATAPVLLSACRPPMLIDISQLLGPQQQTRCMLQHKMGQTDGWTHQIIPIILLYD